MFRNKEELQIAHDPYVYENTNVLKNSENIRNNEELELFENGMFQIGLIRLKNKEYKISSLLQIFDLHQILFGDVYDWAGKARTINIYKREAALNGLSVEYCDCKEITNSIKKLDKSFLIENWNSLGKSEKLNKIVFYMTSLWKIHPFREGNTRIVSTLFSMFTTQINLKWDGKILKEHSKYFRDALVLASIGEYSEFEHIRKILGDTLLYKRTHNSQEYKTINGYEVDKYVFQPHEVKD